MEVANPPVKDSEMTKNTSQKLIMNGSLQKDVDNEEELSQKLDSITTNSSTEHSSPDRDSNQSVCTPTEEGDDVIPPSSQFSEQKDNSSSASNDESSMTCNLSPEKLKYCLKSELEHVFALDNFFKDKFLMSQLDSDQYISLDIILQLKQIKHLTIDADLILELLREFSNLQVDASNTKVRLSTPRSTIILREVPQTTPKEAIEKLFEDLHCPSSIRCEFAGNENWYITFLTEEDAHKAYNHLRENVQNFLGRPIMARIKTSNTFIPSSGSASTSTNRFPQSPSSSTSGNVDVIQNQASVFPVQASTTVFPQDFHFIQSQQSLQYYSPDMFTVWPPKMVFDPYNVSFYQDYMYAPAPMYYSTQDGNITAAYDGNGSTSRPNKSSTLASFRSSGHHHYPHRSHQDHGGSSSSGNGGSYQYRYGSSHNENKPPPRFLRQQMASMNSLPTDIPFNCAETTRDQSFGYEGHTTEKVYADPPPTESQVSTKNSGNTSEKHIHNGYAKTPQSFKLHEEKEVDNNNGSSFQPKTRRFSDRRGGYNNRGSRKSRVGDDGEYNKNVKNRQQESSMKSPKSKDAINFQLEDNSFPPLPTACSSSTITSSSPGMIAQQLITTISSVTSSTSQPSYVQALANATIQLQSPLLSYASYEQRYPQGGLQSTNNSTVASSGCTASSTQHLNNDNDDNDSVVVIDNLDQDSKMPLNKLSYAQIAQRNKTIANKGQDNENTCPSSKVDVSAKHIEANYSRMEKTQEKTAFSNQQHNASNVKKHSKIAAQENCKNLQLPRNGHSYQSDEKNFDATGCEAKRFGIEREERQQQLIDKMASNSITSHHNDHGAKKLVGRLVADDM